MEHYQFSWLHKRSWTVKSSEKVYDKFIKKSIHLQEAFPYKSKTITDNFYEVSVYDGSKKKKYLLFQKTI